MNKKNTITQEECSADHAESDEELACQTSFPSILCAVADHPALYASKPQSDAQASS